ncbi:MAG: haloacid dehalogenase [Anaerolineaceae bacterium]|nr:haloacid dehalogenase [Anaerolineaceae bacterium]
MIEWIAFDADDTLWENERYYRDTQEKLGQIVAPYLNGENIEKILYQTEMENIPHYGYGLKSFGLSMIETAIQLSNQTISSREINQILHLIRDMVNHPVEVFSGVIETLEQLKSGYKLVVITKGDLLDQERKLANSRLSNYFEWMEVVSEKDEATYKSLLNRHGIQPESFLMIGNSLRSDVLPLVNLGAVGVHLLQAYTWEHEKVKNPEDHSQNYYSVNHISELPGLVNTLNS